MGLVLRLCATTLTIIACAVCFTGLHPASAQTTGVQPGQVLISELRYRGPSGPRDEFVELYNNTNSPITVQATDTSGGWAVSTSGTLSGAVVRGNVCTIPNGTVIPARGHLLCANTDPDNGGGYSLGAYPSGNPTPTPPVVTTAPALVAAPAFATAQPDRPFLASDLPDGFGVALFTTTSIPNQTLSTRLDAFGFTSSPALYREGTGFPVVPSANNEHTLYRDQRSALPKDTNNNAADFRLVATTPSIQTRLNGAPGPENLASPVLRNDIAAGLLDPNAPAAGSPNRVRDTTPEANAPLGTMLVRRTFTNRTGAPVSRLRFRVADITTRGTPAAECGGTPCADLRALTSPDGVATRSDSSVAVVRGVRLEENPPLQPEGGGLNSSLSADFITLATPLQDGESVNIQFKLGVVSNGPFRFVINIEAQNSPPPVIAAPAAAQ